MQRSQQQDGRNIITGIANKQQDVSPPSATASTGSLEQGPVESSTNETRAFIFLAVIALTACAVVWLFYLYLAQPPSLLQLGALARIKTIGSFLHSPDSIREPGKTVIVLGDSVALAGFDANVFDQAAKSQGLHSYDLGVSGMSLGELLFFASEPALTGTHVVLYISPRMFGALALQIEQRKLDTYRLLGFSIDDELQNRAAAWISPLTLAQANQPKSSFVWRSNWRILESWRWRLRQLSWRSVDTAVARNMLGPYSTDLKHATWSGQATSAQIQAALSSWQKLEGGRFSGIPLGDGQEDFLRFIIMALERRCASVTIIIAPEHASVRTSLNPSLAQQYMAVEASIYQTRPQVIDLGDLLPADSFRDLMHPNNTAAGTIALAIYDQGFARSGREQ